MSMDGRKQFLRRLAELSPTRPEQAIALLWYYEQTQMYTERAVSDLAKDVEEEGFGRQDVRKLKDALRHNRSVVNGSVPGTFRVNAARYQALSEKYLSLLDIKEPPATSSVIPLDFVSGTRTYLERLVTQINGSYDSGFYDASAVILRRLTESLLVEVYVSQNRQAEIKQGGSFKSFGDLIVHVTTDTSVHKSRSFIKWLNLVKDLGDTAAHHRTYITPKQDIDDNKTNIRKVIHELLILAGIKK